jgi:hypothetical protein
MCGGFRGPTRIQYPTLHPRGQGLGTVGKLRLPRFRGHVRVHALPVAEAGAVDPGKTVVGEHPLDGDAARAAKP